MLNTEQETKLYIPNHQDQKEKSKLKAISLLNKISCDYIPSINENMNISEIISKIKNH